MTTYHTTGTVSVTNGSTAVTGTGTDWATALITAGVIYIEGAAYPISSVESNTGLTTAMPYAGATAAGLAYAIDRQSVVAEQTVTNAAKLAALLEILPTFSEFADDFFQSADAPTAREKLGLLSEEQFGEPFVILAIGESNLRIKRAADPAREWPEWIQEWNVDELDDQDIGTAFAALAPGQTSVAREMALEISRYQPRRPIRIINIAQGGMTIDHGNRGAAWIWSADTTEDDPGAGGVRGNNADPALITEIYISRTDAFGTNKSGYLNWAGVGATVNRLKVSDTSGDGVFDYAITGPAVNNGDWMAIPVTYVETIIGTTPAGAVKIELSPDLITMALNNVPAALAVAGVPKVDAVLVWWAQNDAPWNNGDRFIAEYEQFEGRMTSQAWCDASTPVLIAGINSGVNTGQDTNRLMNVTLQKIVARDARRIFVDMASLPADMWGDSNDIHLIDDAAQAGGGQISGRSLITRLGQRSETGTVLDKETGLGHVVDGLVLGGSGNAVFDFYDEGTWTPELTFATPGDLAVAYSFQYGTWIRVGNQVTARFLLVSSSFTHSTATGTLRLGTLPFAQIGGVIPVSTGALEYQGIDASGRDHIVLISKASADYLEFSANGPGVAPVRVNSTHMPSGGAVRLTGTITYQVA